MYLSAISYCSFVPILPEPAEAGLHGQDDVLADGEVRDDALDLAVLRAEGDAARDRAAGEKSLTGLPPIDQRCPSSGLSMPNSRFATSVRPDPSRPARPTTSPAWSVRSNGSIELERPSPSASSKGSAEMWLAALDLVGRHVVEVGDAPAQHQPDQLEPGQRRRLVRADERAVPQDRDAVGDLVDLVQEVGDEDDRDAFALELPHHLEELRGLVRGQA